MGYNSTFKRLNHSTTERVPSRRRSSLSLCMQMANIPSESGQSFYLLFTSHVKVILIPFTWVNRMPRNNWPEVRGSAHAIWRSESEKFLYVPTYVRDEVTGERRILHNEEINDMYWSSNIIRIKKIDTNETGGACSTYEGEQMFIQGFCGKFWEKGNTCKTQA